MFDKLFNKLFNSNIQEISFHEGFNLTGVPIICLNQGDKVYNFILDTGSDMSIIAEHVLKNIKYDKLQVEGTLYGMEGDKKAVNVCSISLNYKNINFTSEFLIKDLKVAFAHMKKDHGVTVHGLLGSRFFNKYKYIIDFDKFIAYSKT